MYLASVLNGEDTIMAEIAPVYVQEFVIKIGCTPHSMKQTAALTPAIREIVKSAGISNVARVAGEATDSTTGAKYFSVRKKVINGEDCYVYEHGYPLIEDYRILTLTLYINKRGEFYDVSFSQASHLLTSPSLQP